jgi:hypothetical protein
MESFLASLFVFLTVGLIRPVMGAGIGYQGTVANTWPTATTYQPMVPQVGPKVTPTARIHRAQLQRRQGANSVCGFYQWGDECEYFILLGSSNLHADNCIQGYPSHAAMEFRAWPIELFYPLQLSAPRSTVETSLSQQHSIMASGHSVDVLMVMANYVGEYSDILVFLALT